MGVLSRCGSTAMANSGTDSGRATNHSPSVGQSSSVSECQDRVGSGSGRPLWAPVEDPEAFRALFERRRAAYALAVVRVLSAGPPDGVARELLARLAPLIP